MRRREGWILGVAVVLAACEALPASPGPSTRPDASPLTPDHHWVLEAGVFDFETGTYDPDAIYVIVDP